MNPLVTLAALVHGALRPRQDASSPLGVLFLAGLLFVALVGCGGNGTQPFATYHVDRCGGFEGATGMLGTSCEGADELVETTCEVIGGEETVSAPGSCSATWADTERGGSICVHLTCRKATTGAVAAPLDRDAGTDSAAVNVTFSCAEPDGAPAPCFGG